MTPEIQALPFDELRTLHSEIGALIAQRRHEALEQLKQQIAVLGFSPDDFASAKTKRGKAAVKYRDPAAPDHTWSGRGKHPGWLKDKLEQGHTLEEFLSG